MPLKIHCYLIFLSPTYGRRPRSGDYKTPSVHVPIRVSVRASIRHVFT